MVPRKALPLLPFFSVLAFAPTALFDATIRSAQAQSVALQNATPQSAPFPNASQPSVTAAEALKSLLKAYVSPADQPGARDALMVYYHGRGYRPVWVDARGPTRAARQVISELAKAPDYGLDEKTFTLKANAVPRRGGTWTAEQTAAAEFEISTLVLKYANDARGGRIRAPEEQLSSYLDRTPDLPDPAVVLADTTASHTPDAVLRSYQPQQQQFRLLQAAYSKLRSEETVEEHVSVPEQGPLLLKGKRHKDVVALRKRLGLADAGKDGDLYDADVIKAVKAFQKSAGLSADGMVGKKTRLVLAGQSNKGGLERIRANMEAWRWMPADLGEEYLFVNIPAFSIELVKDNTLRLSERVITGRSDKQTPVFSKKLATIVLRPQWHLPDSIKIEKLLSAQRRGRRLEDLGYVIKKGRRTVKSWQVNWAKANLSHYQISQPSGDDNALGDVKFLFPNKHSVYLHDTPSKALFKESERTFSHGCIRLRNPLTVAQTLLDDDKGSGSFNVKRLVDRGPGSNSIELEQPMPIHVAYFTAWADKDGNVNYFRDVYGHEQRIKLALAGKWKAIDKGEHHLEAVDTDQLKAIRVVQTSSGKRGQQKFEAPMGVTNGPSSLFGPAKGYSYGRSRNSVGDIMRNALGGF